MNAIHARFLFLPILVSGFFFKTAQGGHCWSVMERNGHCTDLLAERVTMEECCGEGERGAMMGVTTAWSAEDLDPGSLFFWRVLGGGVKCYNCRETCSGVQCGDGKKCVVRRGRPKCVCAPDCRGRSGRHAEQRAGGGPVCGTDGKTYKTACRLKKRACRRRSATLSVAYFGHCQNSCNAIHCPVGRHCLVDQNMTPHCVRCVRHCPEVANKHVCGADGATYMSACHLREAACHKGRAIPVAYKGRCKQAASCASVRCKDGQICLSDMYTGAPRCVTCGYKCTRPKSPRDLGGPICGSNHHTYHSWCHMLKDACATGYIIETKHAGECAASRGGTASNAVLGLLSEQPAAA